MSTKPDIPKYEYLSPPKIQPYQSALYTAFDDSLTMLEKVNKVIHYLRHYSAITDELLQKWEKVYEWIMGDGLKEAVKDQLEEWLKDGTLKDLIDEVLLGEFNDRLTELEKKMADLVEEIDKMVKEGMKSKLDMEGYYNEQNIRWYRDEATQTHYYIASIPKKDKKGKQIKIKTAETATNYPGVLKTVRERSTELGATLAINASTFSDNDLLIVGPIMRDGKVIQETTVKPQEVYNYTLAWADDMMMKAYAPNTTLATIKSAGYTEAVGGFIPLVEGGTVVSDTILGSRDIFLEPHPRTAVGQDCEGNTYFFVSQGRLMGEWGMQTKDVARILKEHGMNFGFMFDGGGSSEMVEYQHMVNRVSGSETGDRGATERPCGNIMYIGTEDTNPVANQVLGIAGQGAFQSFKQVQYLEGLRYQRNNHFELTPYLQNGWVNYATSGSSICRYWNMPNNTVMIVGTIKNGDANLPFMQLPQHLAPSFTMQFIGFGNKMGEIYKITISSGGECRLYYWSPEAQGKNEYVKIDGIFYPTNPAGQGIQR